MGPSKYSIVIPAFNEIGRLPQSIDKLVAFLDRHHVPAEIVIVDDGSSDGTAEFVSRRSLEDNRIVLVRNLRNRGKGYSIRQGVMSSTGEIIVLADADLCAPVEEIFKLVRLARAEVDIAIGSRLASPGLQTSVPPWYRRFLSAGFHLLTRAMLGLEFKDTQCGFKAFKRTAAKTLFGLQRIDGWGFDPEVLALARRHNFRVKEVGIRIGHDEAGSKVRVVRDSLRMLWDLLQIRRYLTTGAYAKPARVYLLPEPELASSAEQRAA